MEICVIDELFQASISQQKLRTKSTECANCLKSVYLMKFMLATLEF